MADFFLCPAGVQLRDEINRKFPHRDKTSDGWVGDTSHQARKSEHNPCWSCVGRYHGIVLATDTDVDDGDPRQDLRKQMLKELIGDPRVWYVISNGIIYSRTYNWRPRKYIGVNQHFHHVHVSFVKERSFDTTPFFGPTKPVRTIPARLDISKLQDAFVKVVKGREPSYSLDVQRYQRLLVARGYGKINPDGIVGPRTLAASGDLEKKYGGEGRPRVPDKKLLTRVNKGMYRLVA